jgi:hypothetical protein
MTSEIFNLLISYNQYRVQTHPPSLQYVSSSARGGPKAVSLIPPPSQEHKDETAHKPKKKKKTTK